MRKDDGLFVEWRALRARDYAEEGIPVIVGIETVGSKAPQAGEPRLAVAFRRLAEELSGEAGADPAAILELLAARELRRLT